MARPPGALASYAGDAGDISEAGPRAGKFGAHAGYRVRVLFVMCLRAELPADGRKSRLGVEKNLPGGHPQTRGRDWALEQTMTCELVTLSPAGERERTFDIASATL